MKRIILVLYLSVLFGSCAVEEDIIKSEVKSNTITSRIINLDEFNKINAAAGFTSVGTKNFSNQISERLSYSKNYDFTIDTEKILLIQQDDYTSFVMPIHRENSETFENLFLHPYMDGYLAYLVQYELSPEDVINLEEGFPVDRLLEKATFTLLENPDINDIDIKYAVFAKREAGDAVYYNGSCWTVNHVWEKDGETMWDLVLCPGCECSNGSGSDSGPPKSGGGPGVSYAQYYALFDLSFGVPRVGSNGGGASGNSWNPFNPPSRDPELTGTTYPNPIIGTISANIRDPKHIQDCDKLKKITNLAAVKTSLNDLKDNTDLKNEKAFSFNMNGSGGTYATPEIDNDDSFARVPVYPNTYGGGHTHPYGNDGNPDKEIYKMFSIADVYFIYRAAKGYTGSGITAAPLFFHSMVIKDYTYIVFPNDIEAFKGLGIIFESKKERKKLEDKLLKLYKKEGTASSVSSTTLAPIFQKFMSNTVVNNVTSGTDFNVSLYRMDNRTGHNKPWEKMNMNGEPTPCK